MSDVQTPQPEDATARPRRERGTAAQRRAQILAAAREQFARNGFAGTKMREIAAAADVNDALLYRFFASKAQLFEEAVSDPLEEAVLHTLTPVDAAAGVKEVADRFIRELLEAMREVGPLLTVVMADAERGEAFYRERFQPALARMTEATATNMEHWEHQDFDPALLVRLAWGMCWFLAMDERLGDGSPLDVDDVAPGLLNMLWDGLRVRPDA